MAAQTKAPVEPKEPPYVLIEKYGLALKNGWAWLLYPIAFFLACSFFNIGDAAISSVTSFLMKKAASHIFSSK